MGTRNLTMVINNNKTKIAQYGQWDGYLSGQGLTILSFLQENKNDNYKHFKKQLNLVRFATKKDSKSVDDFMESIGCKDGWMDGNQSEQYHKKYPLLTRVNGGEILNLINKLKEPDFLYDQSDFVNDSLFCEYAYVIDFDKNTFEIYTGFNEKPLDKNERFYKDKPDEDGYYPVKLLAEFKLDKLPTQESFLELEKLEED